MKVTTRDTIPQASADEHAQIMQHLDDWGVVQIPHYIEDIGPIKTEAKVILDAIPEGKYPFGKATTLSSHREIRKYPQIHDAFSSSWVRDITDEYVGKPNHFLEGLFITNEYRSDQGLARNAYLHFDRYWSFKFMLYVTDVDRSSGAFSCVPGSHKHGKELRGSAWTVTKDYEKVLNRIHEDYDQLGYSADDVVPVEGKSGTMIIFDTNTFHLGGIIEPGKERLVIRSHTFKHGDRPDKFLVGRIKSSLKSLFK